MLENLNSPIKPYHVYRTTRGGVYESCESL